MIAVIADDLSGAAELAGAALRHGLSAEVQTVFDARAGADVICVDTDSRRSDAQAAAGAAADAARRMAEAGADWIYKKCDSVLRGNVLAEIRAVMGALGRPRTLLVPANPSLGRVVRGGHIFVKGQPLHATDFARDPDHPRTTSAVAELLGSGPSGVSAPDAESEADLARHAASVGDGTLAAGGVDFFAAMLAQRGRAVAASPMASNAADRPPGKGEPPPLTLVICGSKAAWGKRQRQAAERRIPTFRLGNGAEEMAAAFRTSRCVLVGVGELDAPRGAPGSTAIGALANASARVLRDVPVERVLLEGGATASAVVRELGWTRLSACGADEPGVCTLRPFGMALPLLSVKPGSYDWPANLW
jgi:uncharacterized protein YgbK (DUF1537 family)